MIGTRIDAPMRDQELDDCGDHDADGMIVAGSGTGTGTGTGTGGTGTGNSGTGNSGTSNSGTSNSGTVVDGNEGKGCTYWKSQGYICSDASALRDSMRVDWIWGLVGGWALMAVVWMR